MTVDLVEPTVLVVPCYNEAKRLEADPWVAFLHEQPRFELIFVDDGSTDETAAAVAGIVARCPGRMRLLRLPENRGKAEAVRAGMLEAARGSPRSVGFWDADLSTPLEAAAEFQAVLDARPGVQLVTGARVMLLGRRIERSAARHYIGRVFASLASYALRLPVYDTQCGAKLLRANGQVEALFGDPFVARWAFDVELLARLGALYGSMDEVAAAVYELPLRQWIHVPESKVKIIDFPRSVLDLYRISRRYRPR